MLVLFTLVQAFGSFGGNRGAPKPPRMEDIELELAFSSGRHSFSVTLTMGAKETAGGLLDKVSDLIGINRDFLVLWKGPNLNEPGSGLIDEVRAAALEPI